MSRIYPIAVVTILLAVADTHWPNSIDVLTAADDGQSLATQIRDAVDIIVAPADLLP